MGLVKWGIRGGGLLMKISEAGAGMRGVRGRDESVFVFVFNAVIKSGMHTY